MLGGLSKRNAIFVATLLAAAVIVLAIDRSQVLGLFQLPVEVNSGLLNFVERQLGDQAIQYEESMLSEPIDLPWAQDAEEEFAGFLDQQLVLRRQGTAQFECHTNTCRLQIVVGDTRPIEMEEWFKLLRTGIRDYQWRTFWSIVGFAAENANGVTIVTWYFGRNDRIREVDHQFVVELHTAIPE